MAQWNADELNTIVQGYLGGVAVAGVAGGPTQVRATEYRGIIKVHRFTVEAATPNPVPGAAAGSIVNGDTLILTWMDPNERIWFGRLYIGVAWGAGTTMSIGKIDLNNAANTDAVHYKAATAIAAVGSFDLDTNMTEQVGADPLGDQTAGNLIPMFGSNKIWVTATIGGANPNATGTLIGYVFTTEEGN